jgi:hypothetical protein
MIADNPRTHHDALEFSDGQMVLLTDVFEGQEAPPLVAVAGAKEGAVLDYSTFCHAPRSWTQQHATAQGESP